jgi:hypothetical protein
MRAKRWISVLAVLGVLVHAAAVVRHSTGLAGATLQFLTLRADLAQLCHGGARPNAPAGSELPYVPQPADGQGACQLCCGLGSAVALLVPERASVFVATAAAVVVRPASYCAPRSTHAACPPARGPPALA